MQNKFFLIVFLITQFSSLLHAKPFLDKPAMNEQALSAANTSHPNYSGHWVGYCEGSQMEVDMTIKQTYSDFIFDFDGTLVTFALAGGDMALRTNGLNTSSQLGIANWDKDGQGVFLNQIRWVESSSALNVNYLKIHMTQQQGKLYFDSMYFFSADTANLTESERYRCEFMQK